MIDQQTVFMWGAMGGALQEVLHRADLLRRLPTKREKALLRAKSYWVLAVLVAAAGGAFAVAWASAGAPTNLFQPLLIGAAFPSLFKKVVSAVAGAPPATTDAETPQQADPDAKETGAERRLGDRHRTTFSSYFGV